MRNAAIAVARGFFAACLQRASTRTPLVRLAVLSVGILLVGCGASTSPEGQGETEVWGLVTITDSYGWGVGTRYARHIEDSLGVDVAVNDLAIGGLCAVDALERIGTTWRRLVAEAEVVVFAPNGTCSVPVDSVGNPFRSPYACEDVGPAIMEPFEERLGEAYAAIREIRGDTLLLIRTFDAYAPTVDGWRAVSRFAQCSTAVTLYNQAIHRAAAAHGVPVAAVQAAFNGSGFADDPIEKGLIGPDDVHTSDSGKALIARLLHELGYDGHGGS